MARVQFKNLGSFRMLENKINMLFEDFVRQADLDGECLNVVVDFDRSHYMVDLLYQDKHFKKDSYNPMHATKEVIQALSKHIQKKQLKKREAS